MSVAAVRRASWCDRIALLILGHAMRANNRGNVLDAERRSRCGVFGEDD